MRRRAARSVFPFLLVLLLATVSLHAQNFRGAINGTVSDPSGAVVPGAAVVAVNASTGVSWKAVTSSGGEFEFAGLPIGSYNITVIADGFKPEQIADAPVSAGTVYTLPVKLSITSQSQTVQVMATALALDTTSARRAQSDRRPPCHIRASTLRSSLPRS
jgi:hypothetical protein